jgi:hypothetical protein
LHEPKKDCTYGLLGKELFDLEIEACGVERSYSHIDFFPLTAFHFIKPYPNPFSLETGPLTEEREVYDFLKTVNLANDKMGTVIG